MVHTLAQEMVEVARTAGLAITEAEGMRRVGVTANRCAMEPTTVQATMRM
jgi:hypothetical protein